MMIVLINFWYLSFVCIIILMFICITGLDHDLGLDIAIDLDLALVLVFVPFA